jgi:2',3'-cyclic-nucleotide 2'-phosphodiesterase (5'-nucleotidase family)
MPAFVRQHASRFLLFPALAMLLASCMSATPRPDAPPVVIMLIAFNDFHGHIMQNGGCRAGGGSDTCANGSFAGAQFKYLAANVVDQRTGKTLFPGYAIKEFTLVNGRKLPMAFIGLVLRDTPNVVTVSGVAGLRFTDEADAANALVPELRGRGIEAIVILIHEGGFTKQTIFDDATCPDFTGPIKNGTVTGLPKMSVDSENWRPRARR